MSQSTENKEYGSKYHLLSYLGESDNDRTKKLNELICHNNINISDTKNCCPKGFLSPDEKSFESFLRNSNGLKFKPEKKLTEEKINLWWCDKGKRPTWDLLCETQIKNKAGILMLEAKAHINESDGIKGISTPINDSKIENHIKILNCIDTAFNNLKCNPKEAKTHDIYSNKENYKYYQTANRIAYAWWSINVLKIPVVLLFLGFLEDTHFSDFFKDSMTWENKITKKLNVLGAEKLIIGPNDDWSEDRFILIRSHTVNNSLK